MSEKIIRSLKYEKMILDEIKTYEIRFYSIPNNSKHIFFIDYLEKKINSINFNNLPLDTKTNDLDIENNILLTEIFAKK